jgi:hypothetical protein
MSSPKLERILFFTSDLSRTQKFYTALGVKWIYGKQLVIADSGLPEGEHSKATSERGLPDLWGDCGDIEFVFFLRKDLIRSDSTLRLAFRLDVDDPSAISKHLKAEGLFVPATPIGNPPLIEILDPDGRHIILSPMGLSW